MRRFHLERSVDVSGVSGVGRVAEGVVFSTGVCAMAWLGERRSVGIYQSVEDVEHIHGHQGKTQIIFEDAA